MDENAAFGRMSGFYSAPVDESSLGPISRPHLHDELLTRLRDCIIGGELKPGNKIPEKELCERFGVSRTPLREALKVLAFEGLVSLNHNRGSTVSPLNLQALAEAFPVYARFEALAGELACEKLHDDEIRDIRRLHDEMITYFTRRDYPGHFAVNEQFHSRIQAGSRNRNLTALLRSVSSRVIQARHHVELSYGRWSKAMAEHEAIMVAIEDRNGPLVSQLLNAHMQSTFQAILEALSGTPDEHIPEDRGRAYTANGRSV